MDRFSRIDHLISNAGICPFHPFLSLPADLWRRVQDVNLNGAFFLVQAVANHMATQPPVDGERGNIIAISSISALMGGGEQCHYTPTKAGLKSLMESCAIALGPLKIRCNSVLPGQSLPCPLPGRLPSYPHVKSEQRESAADGSGCAGMASGTIETNINKEDLTNPAKRADQVRRVPLGRLGVPEDLAGPTVMLCSGLARYVNGASLLVDGGMAISLQ